MTNNRTYVAFLIPSLGLLVLLLLIPFCWAVGLGFTNFSLWGTFGQKTRFVGIANYVRLFTDAGFYNSVKVTLLFLFLAVAGHLVLGYLFADLIRIKGIVGKRLISTAMLVPWLTPGLVSAYMWQSVLNVDYGWLNSILQHIGIAKINWLFAHPLLSILFANWSRGMAVAFLLLSAALEGIPESVYDAARIDGASTWQTVVRIKIPMIRYSILVTLLVSTFGTLLAFDLIYVLTGGGPLNQTEVFAIFIYNQAFKNMALGFAGAASTVILLITLALGIGYVRSIRVEL
ncbi:MAG TPA: sugar ABC transporter permease [Spirochaetia bacterium]|nr:sugar ABC transporter permease [Spirochaetia bacterium]